MRTLIGFHSLNNQSNDAQTQDEWFRMQGIDRNELLRVQARQMQNMADMAERQAAAVRKRVHFQGTPVIIPPPRMRPLDECRVIKRPPIPEPSSIDKWLACVLVCYAIAIGTAISVWQ